MFPFGVAGRIRVPCPDDPAAACAETVLRKLERMLDDARARTVERRGHVLDFTAGLLRPVWNTNVLFAFVSGDIAVEAADREVRVSYRASTVQLLVLHSLMLLFMEVVSLPRAGSTTRHADWDAQLTVLGLVAAVFCLNYLIGLIRFRGWLKRGARQAIADTRKKSLQVADLG
jgi:hypothetical protein